MNHDEYRYRVCLLCMGKTKEMRKITEKHRHIIEEHLINGYDPDDDRLPAALCANCRTVVQDYGKGVYKRVVNVYDYSEIGSLKPRTRQSGRCDCTVCDVARRLPGNLSGTATSCKKSRGRPPSEEGHTGLGYHYPPVNDSTFVLKKPKPLIVCGFCLTVLAKGKEHSCTKSTRNENIKELSLLGTPTSSEKVASSILKQKYTSPTDATLATSYGKPMRISLSKTVEGHGLKRKQLFSAEDMSKIQVDMNLSTNKTKRLAQHIRTATQSRFSVEHHLMGNLAEKSHRLDRFFTVKRVDFIQKDMSVKSHTAYEKKPSATVYCENLDGLIDYVFHEREYGESECEMKVGVDGGGGFLKICLNMFDAENFGTDQSRSCYNDGVGAKRLKDTSVNKLFIICIAPNVEENYTNILKLWVLLKLTRPEMQYRIATDLKLANILLGLMSHGSMHPCTWCDCEKHSLHLKGELRTLGNTIDKFWKWFEAGSTVKDAKKFGNVIHIPILKGDPGIKVVHLLPPPELHLLLGPVNTMFNNLVKEWPGAMEWAKAANVERDAIHGGSFNGNSCKALLGKIDLLQSKCPLQALCYVRAFRDFGKVVDSCYGRTLDDNYETYIANFKDSFMDLRISVTPKVHAVFHHISDFCTTVGKGLGLFSEQASESVHADFKKTWQKYKVLESHPNYKVQLLRAVQEYNSKHI